MLFFRSPQNSMVEDCDVPRRVTFANGSVRICCGAQLNIGHCSSSCSITNSTYAAADRGSHDERKTQGRRPPAERFPQGRGPGA